MLSNLAPVLITIVQTLQTVCCLAIMSGLQSVKIDLPLQAVDVKDIGHADVQNMGNGHSGYSQSPVASTSNMKQMMCYICALHLPGNDRWLLQT